MYQASEMNLVVFAEYFNLADVTAPRHIHVWLHRNGSGRARVASSGILKVLVNHLAWYSILAI